MNVKLLKNHVFMGVINEQFSNRYSPLKNSVNTWWTEKDNHYYYGYYSVKCLDQDSGAPIY